ncbi:hypothetical protein UC8_06070 [Roseimaritima ulvae]|uniref:Uncharacterized protein n=1 Tax=Roseimaritima ulvae TaxID=980254 RepID=A0A5B9QKX7_9BACT|nr:hypothetical protein UC8_06070 [Roseimaritima ulvae]
MVLRRYTKLPKPLVDACGGCRHVLYRKIEHGQQLLRNDCSDATEQLFDDEPLIIDS